ncbi:hypothetical protein [uncultured virus]|uniref:Uncharacterized protein n=1 Tax=uncultured virus TaxID=340016 RepID=A0A218MKZ8_9VIRU|nr:hypothetical protein [uncultured virus]
MAQPSQRFRTDLVDVAWEMEDDYGQAPLSERMGITADTTKGRICRQWGLVTGGVTLPNPRYEWNPYFGIGVDDRNMTMAIRGRQTLEGSVPNIMLCHDTSRFALEMCFGLLFNYANAYKGDLLDSTTGGSVSATITTTSWTLAGANYLAHQGANVNRPPKYVIIVGNGTDAVNVWKDTWAYIGVASGTGNITFDVYQDVGLNNSGWNGKIPRAVNDQKYRICSIERWSVTTSSAPESSTALRYVDHSDEDDHIVALRTTLTQPSFMVAANFNADDGSRFTTNYYGNKISRTTLTFAEGEPVTFSWDFQGQDMAHNIGEDNGTSGSNTKILKYIPKFTEAQYQAAIDATNVTTEAGETIGGLNDGAGATVEAGAMSAIRVSEQPYFFSGAEIKFKGTSFARFRNFAISVDNALDPRYYLGQNSAGTPDSNRQILKEILEGRRTISFTGSLDMDGTRDQAGATYPSDAIFLQYLLNQGVHNTDDVRDNPVVRGIEIQITLERVADASAGSSKTFDRMHIRLPAPDGGALASASGGQGTSNAVGLILRSTSMNIAAPPQIHQSMDIDGFAASIAIWFEDNTD